MTPSMLPTPEVTNPYLQSWFPLSLSDSALFPALLSSSLTHYKVNHLLTGDLPAPFGMGDESLTLGASYKETVKAINAAMQDPVRVTSDATILAVLMTIEKPFMPGSKDWSQESPFQAPLRRLQWLNVHGAREPNLDHQTGLCRLIQLRGGLHNIRLPGVAAAIFYRVLVNSTLTLSPPPIPFFSLSGTMTELLKADHVHSWDATAIHFGPLCELGLTPDLADVYEQLAGYTRIIKRFVDGGTVNFGRQAMCDQRNLIQYRLMTLPPAVCLIDVSPVYEACRIAAIIYSIGVTFPLPGVGAPFAALLQSLKAEIQQNELDGPWSTSPHGVRLLLWVLTMGGIAATDTAEQQWFVETASRVAPGSLVPEWRETRNMLREFLWLDSACDMSGKQFWTQVYPLIGQSIETESQPTQLPHKNMSPCNQCKAKRIRCDKGVPCENCAKGGFRCSSQTLPTDKPARVHVFTVRGKPCKICKMRKLKCDKQNPCGRCVAGGWTCVYEHVASQRTATAGLSVSIGNRQ
ncbi:hypothetical protein BO70DRAFT_15725 [Aspergillus heteromorphus CBS 117.55]|uniref:Zn(2)-C6 fungal-type domain-containing protein n=1 Tax=Aspergillus heteromorphus CBS 117.55 TaxID=1448321 RepID=A0A317X3B4_9EURO|nr:uncharacterized protein BO70DRAFT_15725 [Aspergillus heteromorphus CBS 117.55]PWY92641.1 hypothetical protein BO70DRAFT_15725 [Aspergillus heteromorphus CBS 117.55]